MPELAIRFTDEDENSNNVHHLWGAEKEGTEGASTEDPQEEPQTQEGEPREQQPSSYSAPLPTFERASVSMTEIKISGACNIDTHGEMTVALDDLVRAVGVFRVTRVNHYVNKHGDVIRQQVLTPVNDLEVVPFDPASGDSGVIQARPE